MRVDLEKLATEPCWWSTDAGATVGCDDSRESGPCQTCVARAALAALTAALARAEIAEANGERFRQSQYAVEERLTAVTRERDADLARLAEDAAIMAEASTIIESIQARLRAECGDPSAGHDDVDNVLGLLRVTRSQRDTADAALSAAEREQAEAISRSFSYHAELSAALSRQRRVAGEVKKLAAMLLEHGSDPGLVAFVRSGLSVIAAEMEGG